MYGVLSFSNMSKIKSIVWPRVVLFGDSITQVGKGKMHKHKRVGAYFNSYIKRHFLSFSFLSKRKDGALI